MSSNGSWRKSSYSTGGSNNCVEVADSVQAVMVRDTTDREGYTLTVPAPAWDKFLSRIR